MPKDRRPKKGKAQALFSAVVVTTRSWSKRERRSNLVRETPQLSYQDVVPPGFGSCFADPRVTGCGTGGTL